VAGTWSGCWNVDHDHDESWLRGAGCIAGGTPSASLRDASGWDRLPLRRSWTILTILIMPLGLISAAGYLGGSRGAALATAGVLIMATVAHWWLNTDDEVPHPGPG
jgi:hypothetical protein